MRIVTPLLDAERLQRGDLRGGDRAGLLVADDDLQFVGGAGGGHLRQQLRIELGIGEGDAAGSRPAASAEMRMVRRLRGADCDDMAEVSEAAPGMGRTSAVFAAAARLPIRICPQGTGWKPPRALHTRRTAPVVQTATRPGVSRPRGPPKAGDAEPRERPCTPAQ